MLATFTPSASAEGPPAGETGAVGHRWAPAARSPSVTVTTEPTETWIPNALHVLAVVLAGLRPLRSR